MISVASLPLSSGAPLSTDRQTTRESGIADQVAGHEVPRGEAAFVGIQAASVLTGVEEAVGPANAVSHSLGPQGNTNRTPPRVIRSSGLRLNRNYWLLTVPQSVLVVPKFTNFSSNYKFAKTKSQSQKHKVKMKIKAEI